MSYRAVLHKLKPLCISKYTSPWCFHHVNMNAMTLSYKNSGNALMTSSLFQDWFDSVFVTFVRRHLRERLQEEKALLFLDNCHAHPPANMLRSADSKFCVMFMPPNTTSIIQPLDQRIIYSFKHHYRTDLVKEIVLSDMDVTPFLKKFYLK